MKDAPEGRARDIAKRDPYRTANSRRPRPMTRFAAREIETAAIGLVQAGWSLVVLNGKAPTYTDHGVKDATRDASALLRLLQLHPRANIGCIVPAWLFVVDIDPRAGGREALGGLEAAHSPLPLTLTVLTGGADRGEHRYFLRPPGPLVTKSRLAPGLDLRMPGKHCCVLPPSVHPETRRRYEWADVTVAPVMPPPWLVEMLRPTPSPSPRHRSTIGGVGARPGDLFAAVVTWHELLVPHGWTFVRSQGDVDYWRRPGKVGGTISASTNATGRDLLHVFSSNTTPFEPDENYTKFGAFTLLEHEGNFSAAARALRRELVSS